MVQFKSHHSPNMDYYTSLVELTPPPNMDFLLLAPRLPWGMWDGEEGNGDPEPDPPALAYLLLEELAMLL